MSETLWLVRTAQNFIAGPYAKEQVCRLIREGRLGVHDEVCAGNGYWFYLDEAAEVARQLGVVLPQALRGEDEITDTAIDVVPSPSAIGAAERTDLTHRPAAFSHAGPTAANAQLRISTRSTVERTGLWRLIALIMLIAAAALVFQVLRILKV